MLLSLATLCFGIAGCATGSAAVDDRTLSDAEFAAKYPLGAINIYGAVEQSGRVGFTEGLTLTEALERVGGLKSYAPGKVNIERGLKPNRMVMTCKVNEINSGEVDDPLLQVGDVIMVTECSML